MANLTKHVGRINNTNRRCVVVFRELPDDPESALVVDTDGLPDRIHENLISVVNSREAQATSNLYEVLHRRNFFDGGNMLQALHTKGYIRKVPVDLVTLYPMPNKALSLRAVNDMIRGDKPSSEQPEVINEQAPVQEIQPEPQTTPAPPAPDAGNEQEVKAYSMLKQAELLEADAQRMRQEAYTLNPSLKPAEPMPEVEKDAAEQPKKKRGRKKAESKVQSSDIAN